MFYRNRATRKSAFEQLESRYLLASGLGSGVLYERYENVPGTTVAELLAAQTFPNSPDVAEVLDQFEAPTNVGDFFGSRMRALLHPPETGEYTFWIASADQSELRLSTDQSELNAALIASVPEFTALREWDKYPEQQSKTFLLTAGQSYYIEVLTKEWYGQDHASVAWSGPVVGNPSVISGGYLTPVGTVPVQEAPGLIDDIALTASGQSVEFDVLLNDDAAIAGLNSPAVVFGSAQSGQVFPVSGGKLRYSPNPGFSGRDSFLYAVMDGTSVVDTAVATVYVNAAVDPQGIRSELLDGVASLVDPIQPGQMVVYGPTAVSVANYPGKTLDSPMVAAASLGKGRVVAVPDAQWLLMGWYGDDANMRSFYRNGLGWLAGSDSTDIKIVIYGEDPYRQEPISETIDWLNGQGFTNVVSVGNGQLADELQTADVFLSDWLGGAIPTEVASAIIQFAVDGGGLFLGDYGVGYEWWWDKETTEIPGNQVLRAAGIGFVKDAPNAGPQAVAPASGQFSERDLQSVLSGATPTLDPDSVRQIFRKVNEVLPDTDTLQRTLDQLVLDNAVAVSPTPSSPVTDGIDKILLIREMELLLEMSPDRVPAHRTAHDVYGQIDPDAPRLPSHNVSLPTDRSGWVSTGLYAPPGEVVTIDFPVQLVNQGYSLVVGSHTDSLDTYESTRNGAWLRVPFGTSVRYSIDQPSVSIATPMGGALFIDLNGNGWGPVLDRDGLELTVHDALMSPRFVLGSTTDAEWTETVRNYPGPYAEFVSDHLAFSVPSSWVRQLDNPTALMTYWDEVVSYMDWLGGYQRLRTGPERINVDVQISIGLLHAGYPIQGPASYGDTIVNLERLRSTGDWGWFHELGHEMQWPDQFGWVNPYTFDGDSEVTVNIFANAALENFSSDFEQAIWGWSAIPERVMSEAIEQTSVGSPSLFDSKANPYPFYFQLADGPWGWDGVAAVLRSYTDDFQVNPEALPISNQQRKDQWLIRFSEAVEYDLTRYMVDYWGLEVSPDAKLQVEMMGLPTWLPITAGRDHYLRFENAAADIPLVQLAQTLDGEHTVTSFSMPTFGKVNEHGDGTLRYLPGSIPNQEDFFTVEVMNSVGVTIQIPIQVSTVSQRGVLLERYDNIEGLTLDRLTGHSSYPDYPAESQVVSDLSTPSINRDTYGLRMRAYLTPPVSGEYTFWFSSDDQGELRLSNSSDPVDSQVIASSPFAVSRGDWERSPLQRSAPVNLEAGKRYYVEALMKEHYGADFLDVAWTLPGQTSRTLIQGEFLKPYGLVENATPDAMDDIVVTDWSSSVIVEPMANDSDDDLADPMMIVSIGQPSAGTLELLADGRYLYVPAGNQAVSETISYMVSDGHGGYADAKIHIQSMAPTSLGEVHLLTPVIAGHAVGINGAFIDSSGVAMLDAWIDFDRNGFFDHPAEHIGNGESLKLSNGVNLLPFRMAELLGSDAPVSARFVISGEGGVTSDAIVSDSLTWNLPLPVRDADFHANPIRLEVPESLRSGRRWKVADHGNAIRIFESDVAIFESTGGQVEVQLDTRGSDSIDTVGMWTGVEPTVSGNGVVHRLTSDRGTVELQTETPWTNPIWALDVNGDGGVSPLDALVVINFIAARSADGKLWNPSTLDGFRFIDVSNDFSVTPLDALRIINYLARNAANGGEPDWGQLVSGVEQLVWPGHAGPLSNLDSPWVPIVSGDDDTSSPSTIVAAREYGAGRILAIGHDGLFSGYSLLDNAQFFQNVYRFLNEGQVKSVGYSTGHSEWKSDAELFADPAADLASEGFEFLPLHGPLLQDALIDISTLVIGNAWQEFTPEEVESIRSFVASGGSLFLAGLGWSWIQYHPDQTMDDYPMGDVAAPFQLQWDTSFISDPTNQYLDMVVFHTFYPDAVF